MIHIPEGNYLTKQEVAAVLGVAHQTVNDWIKRGLLPAIYIGGAYLVNAADLEGFTFPKRGRRPLSFGVGDSQSPTTAKTGESGAS